MRLKGNPTRGLTGTTLGFFFGFAAVSLYGPSAVYFKEAMSLTPSLVGLLVAIPALSGSLLRIPFGAWVETTGGKRPFTLLLILSVIGLGGVFFILFSSYPDRMGINLYPYILFFGFLSGCGIATFSVGIGQVSYWFPQHKQGNALGIYAGIGNMAPGIFSLILPMYLSRFGIISTYMAWWLFLISGTILYIILGCNAYYFQFLENGINKEDSEQKARHHGQELFPSGTVLNSLKVSAKSFKTWGLVFIYFTTFGGFIALTAWFPIYWSLFYELSAVKAGVLTAIFSLLTSAIRVPGGTFSDKMGGERVAGYGLIALICGAISITLSETLVLSLIAAIIMALGMGVTNAAVFKLVPQYVPKAIGGAAGWVGGLGAFGGFLIPPLMGFIAGRMGRIGFARGFLVFIILSVACYGIIYFLKMYKQQIKDPVAEINAS